MNTPFAEILRAAVESTPRAIGGAFAAGDGEMVDFFALMDPGEWALITAHYGVVLGHVRRALSTCHYGEAILVIVEHANLDVVVQVVKEGYYALMAMNPPAPLARAMTAMSRAVDALRSEMG